MEKKVKQNKARMYILLLYNQSIRNSEFVDREKEMDQFFSNMGF